jgi:hypothetical protein
MSQDLEEFLRRYSGLVLVCLWDRDWALSRDMERLLGELERLRKIPVLRLPLTAYRDWANTHGIYGTPAVVVYHHGQRLFRLIGRATAATLLQRLREHGF